jgi:hypothetical protein
MLNGGGGSPTNFNGYNGGGDDYKYGSGGGVSGSSWGNSINSNSSNSGLPPHLRPSDDRRQVRAWMWEPKFDFKGR